MERKKCVIKSGAALLLMLAVLGSSSCVKVPAQAVVLSRTVGERLPDLQASHEAFVSAYFQLSRERVEDFLAQRWIPTFLGNFVQDADLMDKLENVRPLTDEQNTLLQKRLQDAGISASEQSKIIRVVNSAMGDPDRAKLVLLFSEAALEEIELKRKSLLDPINDLEATTLDELRKVYGQVQQAQGTVTAHLSSIRKVTEEQDQVLERLGLLKGRDAAIENAVSTNQRIMDVLDKGEAPESTMKQLENLINKMKQSKAEGNQKNP